jgi:MFS family permease
MYSRQFWLLCWSNFLFTASFQMIIPELPEYLSAMGGQDYIGLIIAAFTLTAGASRPFSGKLTDTIGRIPIMAIGSLVCCVCSLFYPYTTGIWGFLLLRLIHGFSTGTKPTATAAYVIDIIPADRRGEAAGMLGLFTATGMSLGPTLGSLIVTYFNINWMFYVSSFLALISILILMKMKETLPNPKKFAFEQLNLKKSDLFEPAVLPVFIVFILASFSSGVAITLTPFMSKAMGINKGLFFTIYTIASIVVRLLASKISDKKGRLPVLVASCSILALSMVLLGIADTPPLFYAASACFGLAWGLNSPTITAWTADLSNDQNRGKAMATMYIALEAGIGLGAIVAGWVYDGQASSIPVSFYIAALFSTVSVVYMIWFQKKNQELLNNRQSA